jgi:hypothetical protein
MMTDLQQPVEKAGAANVEFTVKAVGAILGAHPLTTRTIIEMTAFTAAAKPT